MYILLFFLISVLILYFTYAFYINPKNVPEDEYIIPKKIFQLIPDKSKIHPEIQQTINKIKNLNPDWNYTLYDDTDILNYINTNFPEYLSLYLKINPKYGAARADFFRYLLMYKEGGVYLDIKSSMNKPLKHIISKNDEYILAHWTSSPFKQELNNLYGEYQQWHIICKPNHPFLKRTIENVIDNINNYNYNRDGFGKAGVLKVTGPYVYSKSIIPIVNKYNYKLFSDHIYSGLVYNSTKTDHREIIGGTHYSKINEPIVLNENTIEPKKFSNYDYII